MNMDLYISKNDARELISKAVQIGFERGLETAGVKSKYISQNRAYKMFRETRVKNWVNDGLIAGKPNGNGKTSTVYYEYAKLLELDTSDIVKIRKPFTSPTNYDPI